MKRLLFVLLISLWFQPFATAQVSSPEGIYYLEGVMETASGMKLNADSTFEFFFSQGALDRPGAGTPGYNMKHAYGINSEKEITSRANSNIT